MRRTAYTLLLTTIALVGCSGGQQETTTSDAALPWETFAARVIAEYYERNPETAVDAGLHEYDGLMSDYSLDALDEYASWLDDVVAETSAYENLEGIEAFERDYILAQMRGQLFWLRESDYPTKNPLFYTASVSVYVDREYAPLEERIVAYTKYVSQIPALVETMKTNLSPPLPTPYLEISHGVFSGFAGYLETTVPTLFADVDDEQLLRQFAAANSAAAEAVQQAAGTKKGGN